MQSRGCEYRLTCWRALAIALTGLWLAGCATLSGHHAPPLEVQTALDKAQLPAEALGLVAFPVDDMRGAWRVNDQRAMQPASTMKLVTTVVALDRLGPNQRGRTDLLSDGAVLGDTLQGDLYLRGGADPDLDWAALWQMLSELRESGVRRIKGDLVVDRHLFRPARMDLGLAPFDEAPEFQYNVIPDALELNGNLLGFALSSDGASISARVSPAWAPVDVISHLALNDKACKDWDDDWQLPVVSRQGARWLIELQRAYPRHCSKQVALNLIDRELLADWAVRSLWTQLGGEINGVTREAATPTAARVLATHQARPLAEVIRGMNKRSDNPLTRLVYLSLGVDAPNASGFERSIDASESVVRAWFKSNGIDDAGLVLDNGSGLSRSERISPSQMAALLQTAYAGNYRPELMASLPIVGVDGTMGRRLKDSPATGRARIKTGTLKNVVAVAGYVQDAGNRWWVVVATINHDQAKQGWPVLDTVIDWVARQR